MPTPAATTTLTAATHSYNLASLVPVVVVALVIVLAGYLLLCWLSPFTRCHHNQRRAYRCRRCNGTGIRLRVGRLLINRLRNTHRHH